MDVESFLARLERRNPAEPEFVQAVGDFADSVVPFIAENPRYAEAAILERLTEPDRVITFRVEWEDDAGEIQVNRGYRVQFNNAIGPYKGGLRFDSSVTLSVLKFLAFDQVIKNSLTTLPMGGGKGGADFNPKRRSEREVRRFCQAFMTELQRHIGQDVDVPAGDIGVGPREIGYLFGHYKRLRNEFSGVLTGKGVPFGGSPVRTEATGYGCVYFAREMLSTRGEDIAGKTCLISGAGNVAQHAAAKLIELGARVVTLSDRGGFVHDPDGLDAEKLAAVMAWKNERRGELAEFADSWGLAWHPEQKPWAVACDAAFPCATENEIAPEDAAALLEDGCRLVCEGANMPCTREAARQFQRAGILYGPGKAANAGGVAISGLEMTQNVLGQTWTHAEVDARLQQLMRKIHEQSRRYGQNRDGRIDYVQGANIAGFLKVAEAMLAYGTM
jgi:glutamate dehydrogenase (NADP+)